MNVDVTERGDNEIIFSYESPGLLFVSNTIELTGCEIDLSRSDNLFDYTYTLFLDGDILSHQDISIALNSAAIAGSSSSCIFEATRD